MNLADKRYPFKIARGAEGICRFTDDGTAYVMFLDEWIEIEGIFLHGDVEAVVKAIDNHMDAMDRKLEECYEQLQYIKANPLPIH